MKQSLFFLASFLSTFIYLGAEPVIDERVKNHYSVSQIASFSESKAASVNFYYRNSFEIKKGDKVCTTCPEINPSALDITLFEHNRKDRSVAVFQTEPGYPVVLLSVNELQAAYARISGNIVHMPSPYETETKLLDHPTLIRSHEGTSAYSSHLSRRTIYKAEFGKGVRLDFSHFDTEAGFDFVKVYDGEGSQAKLIGVYSGSSLPGFITTSSRVLTLEFSTDAEAVFSGWSGTVTPVSPLLLLPPNSQDCQGAIPVCQSLYSQPISYSGTGNVPNEINSSINCLLSGEKNDVWYQFTVQTSGTLCFSITPNNFNEDYDWAVYDLTNANCSDIYNNAALQVSCNYSGAGGVTGANGQGGSQNNPCIAVTAGQSFVLNVSNFSSSQNGYLLDFSSSTAQLFDNVPPQILSVVTPVCGATSMTFNFSENILCNTVSLADFVLNGPGGPYTITSVTGSGCAAGASNENTFTVTLNQPLTVPGAYSICLTNNAGSVTDLCNNVAPPGCLNFSIADITASFAPVATQCLTGNSFSFTNTSTSTASGAMTYSWSFPGASPSTSTAVNPTGVTWSAAGTYAVTLTVTQGTCSETFTQNVSVLLPATAGSAFASPAFICAGTCSNLTLNGYQGSIQWQSSSSSAGPYTDIPGATTTPYQVCPAAVTFYRANVLGCSNAISNYVQISVNPAPNVQITNNHLTVCPGGTATLNASGAAVYTWNPGPSSGANLSVSPSATTTYTVTGTSSGCRDTAIAIVSVNPSPNVDAGTDVSTCQGSPVVLNVSGANAYIWSPATGLSSTTGSTVTSNPSATTTYTITGTSGSNCYDYDTIIVNVLPPPIANAGSDTETCVGTPVTLVASGGTDYTWSPSATLSSSTGSTVLASPVSTMTYTVTASIGTCTSTDEVIVNVVNMPVADAGSDVTVCSGSSATLTGSGGTTYTWSPVTGLDPSDGVGPSVIATPMATTTYTLTANNANCFDTDEVIVNIDPTPVTDAVPDKFICITQNTTLTATGASTYLWSPSTGLNNTSGATVIASPVVTTTYTVTGIINSCYSVDHVIVNVQNGINVVASADLAICPGDTANLSVTGATTYEWSPAVGISSITDSILTATPLATTTYTVSGTTNGCYGSDEVVVTVNSNPVINSGADQTICFGSQTSLSASGAATYTWNPAFSLNDPASATPVAMPGITTTYTLTGTSSQGCVGYDTMVVFVNDLPVPDFNVQESCEYLPVQFTDISTVPSGSIISWFWNFGDNTNSTLQNPSHLYTSPGQYQVTLVVQTDANPACAAVISKTIQVHPKPVASISGTDVCEGFSTSFINSSSVSTGTLTSSLWNFGDGYTSGLASPIHSYVNEGTYTVQLITTSDHNCVDTAQVNVIVFEKPVAEFTSSIVCYGNATTFTNSSSILTGSIQSYEWNLGDGNVSSVQNPVHMYNASGVFNAELIVESSNGCRDTVAYPVKVSDKPVASYIASPVCIGTSTSFINNSTVAPPATIVSWSWSLGDGNTSIDQSPSHLYTSSGSYTTELVIASDEGCLDTVSSIVYVNPKPVAQIWSAVTASCDPVCVNFRDTSVSFANDIVSWSWNFNDGAQPVTTQHPVHCFGEGEYDVTLTITSSTGCSDTSDAYHISSYAIPVAEFVFTPENATILNPVISFNDASENATSWFWEFGDSSKTDYNIARDNIEHQYADTGLYCVSLLVTNDHGCRDSIEHCVKIEPDYVVYTPNAFSPNGDGKNDVFIPVASGINEKGFEMRIYDRWGNLTYLTTDLTKGWNGRFNNNGDQVPEDTYVYIVHFKDLKGIPKKIAGKVTVIH